MGRRRGIRVGAMVGMAVAAYQTFKLATEKTSAIDKSKKIVQAWTGYDYIGGTWDIKSASALIPAVAGVGVSMVASKVGLNRYTPKGVNI